MNREEAIIAMVGGKEVTSDEWKNPDNTYCIYKKDNIFNPFVLILYGKKIVMNEVWNTKTWRLRKYIPKDKELVFCWGEKYNSFVSIGYYDAKNNCIFRYDGSRDGGSYENYAPYKGKLPPNMCKPEELEE